MRNCVMNLGALVVLKLKPHKVFRVLCVAMFPGAKSASRRVSKREEEVKEDVAEEKREWIPETRMNMHPVTSGLRMYPSSGGSLFKNGIDAMTYSEFKKKFLTAGHV